MRTGSMRIAEISLPAIRRNVRRIREVTGGATVIAVIKANGYGHGSLLAARAAIEGGAALLGVTDLEEALGLRAAGVDAPILCWLHGVNADFDAAVADRIEIGVSHLAQLEAVAAAAARLGGTATVQFKVDTGLSRNGAAPAEWEELFARGAELERAGLVRVRGVFSHLANAGDGRDREQAERFDVAIEMLRAAGCDPELVHLAASAATFSSPHLHYNAVRVGVTLFGLSPFADRSSADLGLVPAMTLRSEIVALREVSAGTGVSYGYSHVAQNDTTLALVPIGYADGMPRALNGAGATVAIAGHHCPIVGRIGMDQCIVDLGSLARRVGLGEPVVLFGDPATGVPPVEVWAELMGTINYEIIVGIGSRVVRVGADDETGAGEAGVGEADAGEAGDGEAGPDDAPGPGPVEGRGPIPSTVERLVVRDPEAMHELGLRLGARLSAGDLVILTGPLGAGKTTLTRGIGEGLGVRGPVTSPTFVLARSHPSLVGGAPLVHLDAYRLADAAELDDLDLDFEGSVVVAEWGAGMDMERESWLEIVIERPEGSSVGERIAFDDRAGAATAARPETLERIAFDDRAGAAAAAPLERAEPVETRDDPDELVEPRTVTIAGFGPRWRAGVL